MRLTTKIIIGFILSVFLISLIFIIGFSFSDRKNYKGISNVNIIYLPQDSRTGIHIAPNHVIVFENEEYNSEDDYSYAFLNDKCSLSVTPAETEEDENKLFFPEILADFIYANAQNDTLFIRIKTNELVRKYQEDKKHSFFEGVNFYLHTENIHIANKLRGIQTEIRHIETDSILLFSNDNIRIDSCKANVVRPSTKRHSHLTINNCTIQKLHLDLDGEFQIKRENNNIAEEYISGSKKHNFTYNRNHFGKLIWQPKNKDAKLNVTLQGDTTQIVFQ